MSLLALLLVGCASHSHLTRDETQRVISRAREMVRESRLASADEEKLIAQIEPVVSYYFLARPYAQYSIRWRVSEAQELVVVGQGDIFHLEGSRVERQKPNKAPEPTARTVTPRADARVAPVRAVAHL